MRPLSQRIAWTQEFVTRATKRVEKMREEVVKEKQSVIAAQEKVRHEEALSKMEFLVSQLFKRRPGVDQPTSVSPTVPAHFATELAMLRECVQELHRERDDLRAELATVGGREENRPKKTRTLANPSPDLMITDQELVSSTVAQVSGHHNPSVLMESMINRAESTVRANSSRATS